MDKKEKVEIWVLECHEGEYEDRTTRLVRAYYDRDEAVKEKERLQAYYDKLLKDYESIDFAVEDKKYDAFMEMLKETNTELYEEAVEAFSENSKITNYDYDKFYDEEEKFVESPEFYEYLEKIGCDEETIRLIKVNEEVDNLYWGFPYYYVSKSPIELV